MNKLVKIDPFTQLNDLQRQFFDDDWLKPFRAVNMPATDVYIKDDQLIIETYLPNFDQADINLQVDGEALVISAERHEKIEDKDKKYVVRESSSSFYRRFELPERANQDKIKADFDNGTLMVSVPLRSIPEPKKISVSTKNK